MCRRDTYRRAPTTALAFVPSGVRNNLEDSGRIVPLLGLYTGIREFETRPPLLCGGVTHFLQFSPDAEWLHDR